MHIRNKRRNNTLYISKISYEKTGFRLVDWMKEQTSSNIVNINQ
jgi:hypothetical protein